jgi:hypothetical protein
MTKNPTGIFICVSDVSCGFIIGDNSNRAVAARDLNLIGVKAKPQSGIRRRSNLVKPPLAMILFSCSASPVFYSEE